MNSFELLYIALYTPHIMKTHRLDFYLAFAFSLVLAGSCSDAGNADNELKPEPPTALLAKDVTDESVKLHWTNNSPQATRIEILLAESTEEFEEIDEVGPTVTSFTYLELDKNKVYQVKVRAVNSKGTAESAAVEFKTSMPWGSYTSDSEFDSGDLGSPSPSLYLNEVVFEQEFVPADMYPDASDVYEDASESAALSEAVAMEFMQASLDATLATEGSVISYDIESEEFDYIITLAAQRVGVVVTRAVTFPFGSTYTAQAATNLLSNRLTDIAEAEANVSAQHAVVKSILCIVAWDGATGATLVEAWQALGESTRGDTIIMIIVTEGDDGNIYGSD